MTLYFNRPMLILTNNSSVANPVDVILNDSQDFWVDPNGSPSAEDNLPLPLFVHPKPFSIINSRPYKVIFRIGQLAMDQNAIAEWDPVFNARRALVLPMLTSNQIALNLHFDTQCTQHSIVPRSLMRKLDTVPFVMSALLNFAIAVFTLRIFKRPKAIEEMEETAQSQLQ